MNIKEIKKMPKLLSKKYTDHCSCTGFHESLLRSYHILAFMKEYLVKHKQITDTGLILGIITYLEEGGKEEK